MTYKTTKGSTIVTTRKGHEVHVRITLPDGRVAAEGNLIVPPAGDSIIVAKDGNLISVPLPQDPDILSALRAEKAEAAVVQPRELTPEEDLRLRRAEIVDLRESAVRRGDAAAAAQLLVELRKFDKAHPGPKAEAVAREAERQARLQAELEADRARDWRP